MSKNKLKQLALLGLTSGLVLGCGGGDKEKSAATQAGDEADKHMDGEHTDAEAALLKELDDKHQAMYHSFDAEHKTLAMKMSQQSCAGQNECKGLNQCKGANNACAGQGSCAGMGGCNWKDKNMMVRVIMKHMAEKRSQVNY